MAEFLMLTLVGALMIISPGPDFAIVVKNSLSHGRTSGIAASWGIAIANLCHVAINLLGIGVIIAQSMAAFTMMKILGAAYLVYLGYKGMRTKPALETQKITLAEIPLETRESTVAPKREHNGFYSGFFTSLLNPKAALFYLSFFSVILSAKTPLHTQILYGAWLSTMALSWFILVAIFFTSPLISGKIATYKHWLERFTGGVLIALGLKLLSSEIA